MSTQTRYQTLVTNIGRVYASDDGQRTPSLQRGLDEIVSFVKPISAEDWVRVKTDSHRLLTVWCVKEKSTVAAIAVKDQIHDILVELAAGPDELKAPSLEVSDTIRHISEPRFAPLPPKNYFPPAYHHSYRPVGSFDDEDDELHTVVINLPPAPAPAPAVPVVQKAPVPVPVPAPSSTVVHTAPAPAVPVVQKAPAPVPAPAVPVVQKASAHAPAVPVVQKAAAPATVVQKAQEEEEEEEEEVEEEVEEEEVEEEEVEEVEEEEEEVVEEEVVEEEVVEEEVEEVEEEVVEEEEEGLEVEQITIRGRTYWLDANSNKLYANAEGDEVGDEVGAMVNGKPLFLAQ